ncbi:hypothetical protein KGA66_04460 [Actinocrinis puniceicyclus]|uniref:TrbL/VirB6 plasmid conjugal transfer protein n=1 Tax=Actinocrinis puniceicyclus TaxID=977794 RepID=A0A8J8BBP3_9ACTN|nr:hypothetical protein [Actinocrinis puniceicyclus]MBS2962286.1 hypothetical protein [Actinocrinis puniceicyclus]
MPGDTLIRAAGDACALLPGSLNHACENTRKLVGDSGSGAGPNGSAGGGASTASLLSDPVGAIAHDCAQAASSVIKAVSSVVDGATTVDFTNSGFLTQYAIVFAASAILTVVLWLLAVIKRAVRGESIVTALSEATGFLWLAVGASAFTPVILYGMVRVTDSVTSAIGSGTARDTNNFLTSFANTIDPPNGQSANLGGGPILLIFVSLIAMIAAAVLWVELLIRAAMLYVGAALAATVYAGLVDKSLWHHIRRWAGMMIAVDLAKPVVVIVLGLATAISGGNTGQGSFGSVLSGLAIMLLSIFASGLIFRFVPSFGDDMLAINGARSADAPAEAAAGSMDGPASRMRQGIAAHAGRSGSPIGANPMAGPAVAALGMSAGLAAHGARTAVRLTTTRNPGNGGQPSVPPPMQPPAALPREGVPGRAADAVRGAQGRGAPDAGRGGTA